MNMRGRNQSGSTLLELLVGLVILAMLVTTAIQLVRASQRVFQQGERRQQFVDTTASLSFMRSQLESIASVTARVESGQAIIAFEGTEDSLIFYSAAPLEAEEPVIQHVRFSVRDGALYMWRGPRGETSTQRERALIPAVDRIVFSYGQLRENGTLLYSPNWLDRTTLPDMITIALYSNGLPVAPKMAIRPKLTRRF